MATTEELLRQGVGLLRAGQKPQARQILEQVVDMDDQNAQAWLWLSACVESVEDQQVCLENVLALEPNNDKARKGLEAIRNLSKARPRPNDTLPPAMQNNDPFAVAINDPFGTPSATDSRPKAPNVPNLPFATDMNLGWNDFSSSELHPVQPDSAPPASSVDWGKGSVPAHGSGKAVQLPSAQEYDAWMASLPIGSNPPGTPGGSPAQADPSTFGNFGDFGDLPAFGVNMPTGNTQPTPPAASPFGDFGADSFGSNVPTPAASVPPPVSPFGENFDFGGDFGSYGTPAASNTPNNTFGGGPFGADSNTSSDPFNSLNANFEPGANRPSNISNPVGTATPTTMGAGKSLFDEPFDFGGFAAPANDLSSAAPANRAYAPTDSYTGNNVNSGSGGDDFADDDFGDSGGIFGAPTPQRSSNSRIRFDTMPDTLDTVDSAELEVGDLGADTRGASELFGGSGLFQDDSTRDRAAISPSRMKRPDSELLYSGDVNAMYEAIPAEIQASKGGGSRVGTALLLLLNLLSLAFLAYNFLR